jgi:hypothetical protein
MHRAVNSMILATVPTQTDDGSFVATARDAGSQGREPSTATRAGSHPPLVQPEEGTLIAGNR